MNTYLDYYNKLTEIEKKNSPKELFFKGDFSLLEYGRRVSVSDQGMFQIWALKEHALSVIF